MVSPWLHYEAYDIKFINNIVHDTNGAGFGVNGGYNILLANNTLYRVGRNSHAIELVFGGRGCGGDASHLAQARINNLAGGWGRAVAEDSQYYIPNKNIYIYNNIVYNPAPYRSEWSHFTTRGQTTPPSGTNAPTPCYGDDNIVIKGNILWNGPADLDLGVGESRLNEATIRAENQINTIEPQLTNPAAGNFNPTGSSNVLSYPAVSIPSFSWSDAPSRPNPPAGTLSNSLRSSPSHAGAF